MTNKIKKLICRDKYGLKIFCDKKMTFKVWDILKLVCD